SQGGDRDAQLGAGEHQGELAVGLLDQAGRAVVLVLDVLVNSRSFETGDGELDPDEQPGTRGQRNEAREAEDAQQYVHILEKLSLVRGEWVVGCPYPGDPGQWWLFTQDSAHKPGGLNLWIAQVSGVHHGRKFANLIGEGKQGDGAGCARASRPTGAVDECLGVPRGVDVHDGTHARHIDTPG